MHWSLVTALQVLVDVDSALRFFVGFFSVVGISLEEWTQWRL